MIQKILIFIFILGLSNGCKEWFDEVDLALECSSTVECGSITLSGTTATYPLYFNLTNDDGDQCYYRPDNLGAFGQYVYVSNDKCDCECVRYYEGD